MRMRLAAVAAAATAAVLLSPAGAAADDTLTVDFETGPGAQHGGQRRLPRVGVHPLPGRGRSAFAPTGAALPDRRGRAPIVGRRRRRTPASPRPVTAVGCEFVTPNSTGRLTRTATGGHGARRAVQPRRLGRSARSLTAYRAERHDRPRVGAAVPISSSGFTTPVTVTSASTPTSRGMPAAVPRDPGWLGVATGLRRPRPDLPGQLPPGHLARRAVRGAHRAAGRDNGHPDRRDAAQRLERTGGPERDGPAAGGHRERSTPTRSPEPQQTAVLRLTAERHRSRRSSSPRS